MFRPRMTMLHTRQIFGVAAVLLLVACDASPVETEPDPDPDLEESDVSLDAAEIVLLAIGDEASVPDQYEGRALVVIAEERWLDDVPVLDPVGRQTGTLRANGPGTVRLRAEGVNSGASLNVAVAPRAPVAIGLRQSGGPGGADTVSVRGYRMKEVDPSAVRVHGVSSAEFISADSATLTVLIPPAEPEAECMGSRPEARVTMVGVSMAPAFLDSRIKRSRADEISLGVGRAQVLGEAMEGCVRLPPIGSTQYALIHFDARHVRRAETGMPGSAHDPSVWVHDRIPSDMVGATMQAQAIHLDHFAERPVDLFIAKSGELDEESRHVQLRSTPWMLGETFETYRPGTSGEVVSATVERIYLDHFVLAVIEEDRDEDTDAWLESMDEAFKDFLGHGLPLIQDVLGDELPVTSFDAGQYLILGIGREYRAMGDVQAFVSHTTPPVVRSVMRLRMGSPHQLLALGHEMVHAFQVPYMISTWDEEGSLGLNDFFWWSWEGVADFLAFEMVRRTLGLGFQDNWDWQDAEGLYRSYALEPRVARGRFLAGYEQSSSFLRDLVLRWVRSGGRLDEGVREVSRGALEGWYGLDEYGNQRRGLTDRMRGRIGEMWNPEDAILLWTASQAVDDLTENEQYQNASFKRVSWRPHATIEGGSGLGSEVTWPQGGSGYFVIEDDGFGGSYEFGSSLSGTVWKLVRFR